MANLKQGLEVYDNNNQYYGTIDQVNDNEFMLNGQRYPVSYVTRVEGNRAFIQTGDQYATTQQDSGTMRVPVAEERLNVGKQQVQQGEVNIHKTVEQEQVNVPVELRREEVRVNQVNTNDRPLSAEEAQTAFQEGTIRVPVRGEQAVVNKETVVTGEVDVEKDVVTDRQQVADTVRRERVQVDDMTGNTGRATGYQQNDAAYTATTGDTGYNQTANTTDYATSSQYQVLPEMEVFGSDNDRLGKIKEVYGDSFIVGRFLASDLQIPFTAINNVNGDDVLLNIPADQAKDLKADSENY